MRGLAYTGADRIVRRGRSEAAEAWAGAPTYVRLAVGALGVGVVAVAVAGGLWAAGFAVIVSIAALLVGGRLVDDADRRWIVSLMLIALAARWLVGGGMQAVLAAREGTGFLFPDELAYDRVGDALRRAWFDGIPILEQDRYLVTSFTSAISVSYTLAGHEVLAARALNAAVAILTVAVVHRLAKAVLGGRSTAGPRLAAGLAAFYPTTFGWSILVLKDTGLMLATCAVVLVWLTVGRGARAAPLIVLALALGWIMDNRAAQAAVLLLALAAAATAAPLLRRPRRLPVVVAAAAVVLAAAIALVPSVASTLDRMPDRLAGERALQAENARTAISAAPSEVDAGTRVVDSSWPETLAYLPGGLAAVLLGPYPWEAENASQAIGAALSVLALAFYALALVGGRALWRTGRKVPLLHLAAVIGSFWVLLALTAGNAGTAFRHRDAVFAFVLVLAARGILELRPAVRRLLRVRRVRSVANSDETPRHTTFTGVRTRR